MGLTIDDDDDDDDVCEKKIYISLHGPGAAERPLSGLVLVFCLIFYLTTL